MINKVAVFGAGVWGSVLAQHIAKQGRTVVIWEHFEHLVNKINEHGGAHPNIPGFRFRHDITITRDMDLALADADLILIVISSKGVRALSRDINRRLAGRQVPVVSAAKGIEDESLLTLTEIIEQEMPSEKNAVMAFSGPSFALEVAHAMPTKIVLAGKNRKLLERTKPVFNAYPISVELSDDPTGIQWAGAAKNVLAIACGVVEGLGKTINTKAALVTLAMREINDVVIAAGGRQETVYGLAGLGDFILTGTSTLSRNTRLGIKLGQGKSLAQARGEISTVTEGADSVAKGTRTGGIMNGKEIEIKIYSLATTMADAIMFLEEVNGIRLLPIWIGPVEGQAIAIKFSGIPLPRPFTHDLLLSVINAARRKVVKIVIDKVRDNTYYSSIYLTDGSGETITIDARPSDAIALAVRAGCPMYIEEEVLEVSQVLNKPISETEVKDFKSRLKNITPQDIFGDLKKKAGGITDQPEEPGGGKPPQNKPENGEGPQDKGPEKK